MPRQARTDIVSVRARAKILARTLICVAVMALGIPLLFPAPCSGDVIWKRNGSKLVGKVLVEEKKRIQVLVKIGKMEAKVWIDRKEIDRIETGELPEDEFQKRLGGLDPADLPAHEKLLAWAQKKKLRAAIQSLKKRMPEVEWRHRKASHPKRWCRQCDARGQRPCPECKGKGKLLDPCQRCNGEGVIRCRVCAHKETPGVLRCRKCSGGGQIERFDVKKGRKVKVKCPDCRGSGEKTCPECDGKLKQRCLHCKGEKGVSRDCPRCNRKPFETCLTCGGSGLQPKPVTDEQLASEQAEAKRKTEQEARRKAEAEKAAKANEAREKNGNRKKTSSPDYS